MREGPSPRPARRTGEERILTLPNAITTARLAAIPLFVWLLFGKGDRAAAAILLAVLGSTDWVDGFVARRYDQVSELGKVLDPLADRLLLGVAVVSILIDGSVPLIVAVLALVREAVVAVAALVLAAMGVRRIDVTLLGKAATFCLMASFPLFLASASTLSWAGVARVLAWIVVVPGLVLSYVSAAAYVPLAKQALAARGVGSAQ
ncbi:MAG TPA: CDP-alcohol phosphatidyltransferase family protein [Acidimicrobiales bacterium]|nr:CDP-alcohol phosphatidyltransferase family protein [Acidimicrobiales bacterium]